MAKIRAALLCGETEYSGYSMNGQQLIYRGRLVLPRTSPHISKLLQEFHGSTIGGRSVVLKSYRRLAVKLYWAGIKKDVKEMVARCVMYVSATNTWQWRREGCCSHQHYPIRSGRR